MIDGKIARRYNMITTLGKILDPLADKITQFTLTLCLSLEHPVLMPVLALSVVKELFQLIMGILHLRKGQMLPGALMIGKVSSIDLPEVVTSSMMTTLSPSFNLLPRRIPVSP